MATGSAYGGKFCSPEERQITTLGTGYIANFLSGGGAEKAGATLTNKRVYFSGNVFTFNDKGQLTSIKEQKIVNVRDITGAGYKQYSPIQYVIWAVAALISGIAGFVLTEEASTIGNWSIGLGILVFIVLLIAFFVYQMTLLSIEYAGGNIAFDARWLQSSEQDIFIRNIHLAKDKLYSMAAVEQGFVSNEDTELIFAFDNDDSFDEAEWDCENCGNKNPPQAEWCGSGCGTAKVTVKGE